jgi:hypothetical protein
VRKAFSALFTLSFENRSLLSHEENRTLKIIRVSVQFDMWWVQSSILSLNPALYEHGNKYLWPIPCFKLSALFNYFFTHIFFSVSYVVLPIVIHTFITSTVFLQTASVV